MTAGVYRLNKVKQNNKVKFYHTSGTKFSVGNVIGGPGETVFMHTKPVPHSTIQCVVEGKYKSWTDYKNQFYPAITEYWDKRMEWNENPVGDKPEYPKAISKTPVRLFVYEVKAFNKPKFGVSNAEYFVQNEFVEIIRVVGNANGILNNFTKKFGNTRKAYFFGGASHKPNSKHFHKR